MRTASPPSAAYILGGGLISLGMIRSLGRRGIPITLFDGMEDDIAYHSRYVRTVRLPDCDDVDRVIDRVVELAAKELVKPVLLVSGDRFLLQACRNAERLQAHLQVLLPSREAAESVVNKDRFQAFAEEHAVPVPRTWLPKSTEELRTGAAQLQYPVVLKPVRSMDWHVAEITALQGHIKMIRADGPETLIDNWTRLAALGSRPMVQEYIEGGDCDHYSYVSYRDRQGRELAGMVVRKLRLHPIHGGLATHALAVEDPWMREAGRRVLEQLQYRSVASVCFKRDPVTGRTRIFEINGRLPLVHGLLMMNGMDMPWLMYRDALGLSCPPLTATVGNSRWLALSHDMWGVREYVRCGELRWSEWLKSLLSVRHIVELDPRDPGIFLHWCGTFLQFLFGSSRQAVRGKAKGKA